MYVNTTDKCNNDWWRQILFIGIFGDEHSGCFGWGWYMQAEWWIFMSMMLVIIVMSHNRVIGKACIFATFLACQIYVIVIFYQNDYGISISFASL
jgi:hypothetical protein